MSEQHPIPGAVLAQHLAILGKTGAGKTSTEKVIVEQVVADDYRVCVLDTTKSDWWGLTSSADGKRPGLPFRILGGPRGHVPLHSSAGKAIGQLVGSGKLPLSIIDMADFEPGGIQRFFVDFAPALMRSAKGVLYLVIEEAHELAPKERAGFGAENMAIHWAKKLATAGRSKGIRLIVATQRVQSLHNAVLGSCETVVAHRLTTPADQEPVIKWLKANADPAVVASVRASLSSLPTGTGWICSGEARIFEQRAFPKFKTYDNTATPTRDGAEIDIKTAPVDQDELRAIIGDAVKEAEADDPKALRARIVELGCQLAIKPQALVDHGAIEEIKRAAYDRGVRDSASWLAPEIQHIGDAIAGLPGIPVRDLSATAEKIVAAIKREMDELDRQWAEGQHPAALKKKLDAYLDHETNSGPPTAKSPSVVRTPTRAAQKMDTAAAKPSPGAGGDGTLTGPQRHLLQALAWWRHMGHATPTRVQLAAIAGWTPKGSNLRNRLSELTQAGLIEYPGQGLVGLTPAGAAAAPAPEVGRTLITSLRETLTQPQRRLFEALLSYGHEPVTRDLLAADVEWEPGGSNLRNRLSELSQLEIIRRAGRGAIALQEWVR